VTPAGRAAAERLAAALILRVLDGDADGATVLLGDVSHEVIAQACVDLARWITYCIGDEAEAREAVSRRLLASWALDPG